MACVVNRVRCKVTGGSVISEPLLNGRISSLQNLSYNRCRESPDASVALLLNSICP